jgi:hypothetical protein
LSEVVNALRRSGLTVLKMALAVAREFNIKRPFPFHDSGTQNRPSLTNPLTIPKTFANQPAPQTAKPLLLPNRFANNVCASLSRPGRCKNGRFPSETSATQNGRSPTNAPQFPKTYPINLWRNRQNRCHCQLASPKTSAPTLPGNGKPKPAFTHQNLRRSANADQPTGLNFTPPCRSNNQAQNDPKLVAEPRQLLLSKADALPKRSTGSGLLLLKPFAVCQNLKMLSSREPTRILEKNRDSNLTKWPQ